MGGIKWDQYWKRKGHKRKELCTYLNIDSKRIARAGGYFFQSIRVDRELKGKIEPGFFRISLCDSFFNAAIGEPLSIELKTFLIPLEKQPINGCTFFFCPGCNRRMVKLYFKLDNFLCRKCHNLCYYSQRLSPWDRRPPI